MYKKYIRNKYKKDKRNKKYKKWGYTDMREKNKSTRKGNRIKNAPITKQIEENFYISETLQAM